MKTIAITLKKILILPINIALPLFAFAIPLFVSGPQLLTGSLVNCFLFLSTSYSSKKTQATVIILPSIAAILNGVIFNKFTPFLAIFLPFIWIGNWILVQTFKKKSFLNVLLSAFLKSMFLFLFAFMFFKLSIVPKLFLQAMGVFQFITAVVGGIVFLGINRFIKSK